MLNCEGQSSLDDQQCISKTNFKSFKQSQKDQHQRKSFTCLESARVEEEDYEEDSSVLISELFHGFLAIGTLGSDQVINDPLTPKFSICVENITEAETEVTENDLKLINDELEKVLGAETKEDECNESSGRNSHVSIGRSSHGSTITLSGKPTDGQESNMSGTIVCPLQEYLFGSATEASETRPLTKKENRTSLGDLFQKSKISEEISGAKCDKEEKRPEKELDKSALHLMKKKLKKRMLLASSRSSTAPASGLLDSASGEKKLHKILHMFHRKVHPEEAMTTKKSDKPQNNEKMKKTIDDDSYNNEDHTLPDEDIVIYPQTALNKQTLQCYKSHSDQPQFALSSSDSDGNGEHWIKTDADYLVLEL